MALLATQVIFCGWVILAKVSVSGGYPVKPIVFCFYRETLSALFMLGIAWHTDGVIVPHSRDIPRIVMLGCCTFLCIFGYLTALEYTSAADAALLAPLQPVMAIIMGALVGLEQLTLQRAGGVLMCTLGSMTVTVFSGDEDPGSAPNPMAGMLILLGTSMSAAVLFLAQKKLLGIYPSPSVTAWYYTAAGIMTTIVAMKEAVADPAAFVKPFEHSMLIFAMIYAVIFATVVNYEVLSWANQHTAASTVMSFAAIQPMGTTLLSYFLLHTEVHMAQIVGGLAIIVGLFFVAMAPTNEEQEPLSTKEMDNVDSSGFTPRNCIRGFNDSGTPDPVDHVEHDYLLPRSPGADKP